MRDDRSTKWKVPLGMLVVVLLLGSSAPAISRAVVQYARNAGKVDGRHAVGPGASSERRAGKLVATDRKGFLPNNIIREARDSRALDGVSADRYTTDCDPGSVGGVAAVEAPASLSAEWTSINGYMFVHTIGGAPPGADDCELTGVEARRLSTGVYDINVGEEPSVCFTQYLPAVITPHAGSPAYATHETRCDEGVVIRVSLWDQDGNPVEVPFDVVVLRPVVVGLP